MLLWLLGALGFTGGGIGIVALLGGGPAMLLGLKWLWGWLGHATFLQVVCVVLIGALAIDHIALLTSHRHAAKVEAQLAKASEANKKLAAQSKVKVEQVTKTVDHYITVTKPVIQKEVETIEAAPLPGNCKTPKEITDADV